MTRKGLADALCQVPWGPWAQGYKGRPWEGQPSDPEPGSGLSCGCEPRPRMMRALLLAIGLGLVAALQAQEFPAVGQPLQDVRLRWGDGAGGRQGEARSPPRRQWSNGATGA